MQVTLSGVSLRQGVTPTNRWVPIHPLARTPLLQGSPGAHASGPLSTPQKPEGPSPALCSQSSSPHWQHGVQAPHEICGFRAPPLCVSVHDHRLSGEAAITNRRPGILCSIQALTSSGPQGPSVGWARCCTRGPGLSQCLQRVRGQATHGVWVLQSSPRCAQSCWGYGVRKVPDQCRGLEPLGSLTLPGGGGS